MKTINVTADVEIPSLPNFFIAGNLKIPIEAVEDQGLRDIGKAWTEELIKKAHTKQKKVDK